MSPPGGTPRPPGGTPGPGGFPGADVVEVRGLRVIGIHGTLPHELTTPQPFEVDLDVEIDAELASAHDDLASTADYAGAVQRTVDVVRHRSFRLLESLAVAVAEAVLEDPAVRGVTVSVHKVRPPLPQLLASVGVRITRRRARPGGHTPDG